MIIAYEKPESVKAAHTKWLASLEQSKKVAARFLEGPEDNDNAIAQAIVKRLDSSATSSRMWRASWKPVATTRPPLPTA